MNNITIDQIAEDAAQLYRRLYDKLPLAVGKEKKDAVIELTARAMPAIVESYTKP